MPTPSEQKALAFVAIVILLGGAVRVLRAGPTATPTAAEQQGVARQARAADSAATASARPRGKVRTRKPKPGDTLGVVVGGVSTVPPSFARPDQPFAKAPFGYPPPGPRIDVDRRTPSPAIGQPSGNMRVNLNRATAGEIEKLPLVGPVTARRIVASRDSLGPFPSLEALRRVKGIGARTIERIGPLVTFDNR